nr:MAG TPA: hypothetical protein [Caudoviricetes sp.]
MIYYALYRNIGCIFFITFLFIFQKPIAIHSFMCYNIYKLRDKQEVGISNNVNIPQ